MASFKTVLVCVFGVFAVTLPVSSYASNDILTTHMCEAKVLVVGRPLTIWDICGNLLRVYANITDYPASMFPWTLTTYIDDIDWNTNSSMSISIHEADLHNGHDITHLFGDHSVTIYNTDADGRYVRVGMTLESMDMSVVNNVKFYNGLRRTSPDFSGCNIILLYNLQWGSINMDDHKPTIHSYFASQGIYLSDLFSVSATGCPTLQSPAGYYMALYYYNSTSVHSNEVRIRQLIGTPQKWKSSYDISNAFLQLSDSIHQDTTIIQYGTGYIELSLDVMNTTGLSSTSLSIPYTSTVQYGQDIMPTNCSAIYSGWDVNNVMVERTSVPYSLYSEGPYINMYNYDSIKNSWTKVTDRPSIQSLFYQSVMQRTLSDNSYYTDTDLTHCSVIGADDELKSYIQDVEDPQGPAIMPHEVPANISRALNWIDYLESGMDVQSIKLDVEWHRSNLVYNLANNGYADIVRFAISAGAYYQVEWTLTANITNIEIKTNVSEHQKIACNMASSFKEARSYLHKADRGSVLLTQMDNSKARLHQLADNAARAVVLLRVIGQPTDDPIRFLNKILSYAELADTGLQNDPNGPPISFDALFSPGDIELARNISYWESCFPWPTYLQKFVSICNISKSAERTNIMPFMKDVCMAVNTRKLVKEIWKVAEFREYRELRKLIPGRGACARYIMEPLGGVTKVYQWRDCGSMRNLYQGTIGLDMATLYWSKVATCGC